jgi:hypothetical protein
MSKQTNKQTNSVAISQQGIIPTATAGEASAVLLRGQHNGSLWLLITII